MLRREALSSSSSPQNKIKPIWKYITKVDVTDIKKRSRIEALSIAVTDGLSLSLLIHVMVTATLSLSQHKWGHSSIVGAGEVYNGPC